MIKKLRLTLSVVTAVFGLNLLTGILLSCNDVQKNHSHQDTNDESIVRGKQLAAVYCQSCHLLPDPALLDTKSWEKGVLPHMGPLLGIFEFNYQRYPFNGTDRNLDSNFYPARPLLTQSQWQSIIDYYTATSPDSLEINVEPGRLSTNLRLFSAELPVLRYNNPATSYVKIENRKLITCDLFRQKLYRFDKNLLSEDSLSLSGAIVDINFQQTGLLTCNIGVFNPNNARYGEARFITTDMQGKLQKDTAPLFNGLMRPVQIASADVNLDGKTDYIVCEFGYLKGALAWMEQLTNNTFRRHVIKAAPGAVKAYVQDVNHDGLPDLWVLFAQGDESVSLFTNIGNGQFKEEKVLRFPPSYGSSYFELADFNKDGYPDIVYTCGDNADYSTVLKPYHGVYVFLNDGKNRFTQRFFFHINGCYKAMARDFDGDGDVDIAAISFFADYRHRPEEGFVYLENTGSFAFKPYTLPEAKSGRWITMDAGDLDGDGRTDLVLGNFSSGPTMMTSAVDWAKGPPFLVLKNTEKH